MRINAMILGRADLRKGVSGAKFDAESDFEVRLAIAPQKPRQICKKLPKISKKIKNILFQILDVFRRPSVVEG